MRFFLYIFGIFLLSLNATALTLTDPIHKTQFFIDPHTLAAHAILNNGTRLNISSGSTAQQIRDIKQNDANLQWQRNDINIEAFVDKDTFVIRFKKNNSGEVIWPQVPTGAKALILPLSEGSYIPTNDVQWRTALQEQYQNINTTQDLSLPAIGFDYGQYVLSVIYANPFNNTLYFDTSGQGVELTSKHSFTRFNQNDAFEVRISIDENDLLAPAKRFRVWSQQQGKFISLKNKLAAVTDGQRLIGASHIYIWGERILTPRDVKDWKLLQHLTPTAWLKNSNAQELEKPAELKNNRYFQELLIKIINENIEQEIPGYSAKIFMARRKLLTQKFGTALNTIENRGDLNPTLIHKMKQKGLEKLWLGVPQWTVGYANPLGIKAARNAGYLIGPYDSYDTALPDNNNNPSWLTAQLGQATFLTCGIMLENGQRKTGFQNQGVYTNPSCVKPLMEKRVQQLQKELGFNSWFMDVDATGMLFDDYDPQKLTSQAQDAKNRIDAMAWVGKKLDVVVGSEDGHAVANASIAFAHGLQVRGFGWKDKDMRKNESSPFYLGKWYPSHQPEFFFKKVSIKPEYQSLYFNPAHRLPLFQAAFHDSVITTNHWTLDNLKFKETRQSTELLQQLYNLPPMLNISLDSANERLNYLKRIDAFFRPMHSRLYDKALVEFKFLTDDRLLQQTRFSDNTIIIANFGTKKVQWGNQSINPNTLIALLPDGEVMSFETEGKITAQ